MMTGNHGGIIVWTIIGGGYGDENEQRLLILQTSTERSKGHFVPGIVGARFVPVLELAPVLRCNDYHDIARGGGSSQDRVRRCNDDHGDIGRWSASEFEVIGLAECVDAESTMLEKLYLQHFSGGSSMVFGVLKNGSLEVWNGDSGTVIARFVPRGGAQSTLPQSTETTSEHSLVQRLESNSNVAEGELNDSVTD